MTNYTTTTPPSSRYNYSGSPISSPTPTPFPSPSSSSSYTGAYTASPRGSNSTSHAKRKQVKNACVNCQKACKKCDDQRPCSRCVKYGIEDGCINSQRKERKKKSSSEDQQAQQSASLTSRRMTASSPVQSQQPQINLTLRLSSRNGIRPFPKELLQSLQQESESLDYTTEEDIPDSHEEVPIQMISPQVTDEFKTLAKICSDLHTVMAQPAPQIPTTYFPHPYPAMPVFYQIQPQHLNPFQPACFVQQHQQRQPSFNIGRPTSPPLIQRRSVSPTQMLLKPTSPIFNQQNLSLPHQHQQMFYTAQSAPPQTSHILRNMNRTPPEDDDQLHENCEHGCEH